MEWEFAPDNLYDYFQAQLCDSNKLQAYGKWNNIKDLEKLNYVLKINSTVYRLWIKIIT